MSLNARLVSELIRQKAGWKDDSQAARVVNLIPQALKEFGRLYAADPYTRPLLTTNKNTTSIPITSGGQVSLSTGYSSFQFLEEYLDLGQMYFLPTANINLVSSVADTVTWNTYIDKFHQLDGVQFTSTGSLPGGISAATTYYITSSDDNGTSQLSPTRDTSGLVNISSGGSGVISMLKQTADGLPMQTLRNPQQAALPQYLDSVFMYCYVDGNILYVLPTTAAGSVAFAVPYYPSTLAALPVSNESEKLFLQVLMNLVDVPVQAT